jgi:hypothetical protein
LTGDASGRRDGDEQARTLLAHHWQHGASDIHRTEQERLDLMANLFWAEFLEEAGEEITRVVDQNVDSAELRDGGLNGRLRILRACHIELDGQQVVVVAYPGRDLRSIAASGDNGVAGGQGGLGDVDPQASASAGDEPHSLFTHGMSLTENTSDQEIERGPANLTGIGMPSRGHP